MRQILLFICGVFLSMSLGAQSISVKDVPVDESTTIEVKKGKQITPDSTKKLYQIMEENVEVTGDPAPLMKAARENWTRACAEWKKELRELNVENKILSMNCGKPQCQTSTMETSCSSDGKSKIRVAISD